MEIQFTKKIYYKRYDHRFVINIRSGYSTDKRNQPTGEVVEWLLKRKFTDDKAWRAMATYSYVTKTNQYSVFCKGSEIFDYLKDEIGEEFINLLEKPLNDDHVSMLESNDKLVTRKQLFYGKYRMCLRVSPEQISSWQTSTANIQKIKDWCREQFGNEFHNSDRYMISGWSKGNFYFADPKDALLFKLTWGGQDVKTERVITVAELKAAEEEANA